MLPTLILSLLPALPASAPPPPAPAPAAQDEEFPDKRPEVKELLETLKEHVKQRGEQDAEAIAVIDKLLTEFERSGPKDRDSIVDGVSDCLSEKRRELSEGVPNNQLFIAAGTALGRMGPESVKPLSKWIGHKKLRDDVQVQRALILALGRTRDEGGLKALRGCLDNFDAAVVAAGVEALGEFEAAEQQVRKDLFEEVLKLLMSAKGNTDNNINDVIARERYDVIAAPCITTLKRLSGQDENQPEAWQRWWNKNKKADWDEKEDGA